MSRFAVGEFRPVPSADPVSPRPACQWRRCQWCRCPWVFVVALAGAGSFALGYWVSDRRLETRAHELSQRRFGEFLLNADSLGIIDHGKLQEILQAGTENDPITDADQP
jgi:hypothetical protein